MQVRNWVGAGALALLTACGGGGGSGGGAATPLAEPVVARGAITGFGSVVVSGIRYSTTGTSFDINDEIGSEADLSIGQLVTIIGTVDDRGRRTALQVVYDAVLRGPVESVDVAAGTLLVAGQTLRVDASTRYDEVAGIAELNAGDYVEVSGLFDAAGQIQVSFLTREEVVDPLEVEVEGQVELLDPTARRFMLNGLTVDYGMASEFDPDSLATTIGNGDFVEVEGVLDLNGVLIADEVELQDEFGDVTPGTRAEVEGVVTELLPSGFRVETVPVNTTSATRYTGDPSEIALGATVEVTGRLEADGSITAFLVEVERAEGELAGTVEEVDLVARTVTVLGVVLHETVATEYDGEDSTGGTFGLASLLPGDYVEIEFEEGADGKLLMLELERDEPDSQSGVSGLVDSFDPASQVLVIAGVIVDASAAVYERNDQTLTPPEFYATLAPGVEVEVEGVYDSVAGVLRAEDVEAESDDDDDDDDDD